MIFQDDWELKYTHEIERALLARSSGNEGMARVCARRAAGIVIGEYLARRGVVTPTKSAFQRLSLFINRADVDQADKEIAGHFLLKVNHDHQFPADTDLVRDAKMLKCNLLAAND